MSPTDFKDIFSITFQNIGRAISTVYMIILQTSPLPDWLDFILVVVVVVAVIGLFISWVKPRS